ncbi:MAG: uracil-DNA glycosylase [Verrucomicrobiota bacterium]
MRSALLALTDELRRLKTAGVKTVAVSDSSVAALRKVMATMGGAPTRKPAAVVAGSTSASLSMSASARAEGPAPASISHPPTTPPAARSYEPPPQPVAKAPEPAAPKLPPPPVFKLPEGDKDTRWKALLDLVLNDPTCKANVRPGKKVVLGVGSLDAKIMFVGEAPGGEEEIQGEPFVGPAGQLLTKMIQAMGLKRSDVYIGNIMNWRPQLPTVDGREQVGNRPPTQEELVYCLPFLRAQIEIVNPDLLVALGSTAAQGLLGQGSFKALGEIRGLWKDFAGKPLMVTYHPSYILRNQSNRSKRMIWEDLLKVMERAGLAISDKQRGFFLDK